MSWLFELHRTQPIAQAIGLLAFVCVLGMAFGSLKYRGIGLGTAGVLFAGIIVGHFGHPVDEHTLHFVKEFGLMLFVYTIGLQLGPGFFAALKDQGVRLNLMAATIVISGAVAAPLIGWLAGFDMAAVLGIYAGSVTNTPSLGAASQTLSTLPNIAPDRLTLPALGYAVVYPMAIIGIIGTLILLKQIFRIDPVQEAAAFAAKNRAPVEPLERRTLVVTNSNLNGLRVDAIPGRLESRVTIARVCHGDNTVAATDATIIHHNDRLAVVGTRAALEQFERVIGTRSDEDLVLAESEITYRRVIVTDRNVLGKTIDALNLDDRFNVAITRVTRADLAMTAVPGLRLQYGDQLQIVGRDEDLSEAAKAVGNSLKDLNETHFIPFFIGLVIGIALGTMPIPIPGLPQPIKLGLAGGPLIAALLLSRVGRIRRQVWHMPVNTNLAFREFGIALFFAAVGLGAGAKFFATVFSPTGLYWLLAGIVVTVLPILLIGIFARAVWKLNFMDLSGVLAGSMTDPPALAFACNVARSDAPTVGYATVYPLNCAFSPRRCWRSSFSGESPTRCAFPGGSGRTRGPVMEFIRALLEQQPLMALFLTVAIGYLVGEIDLKGFSLGVGAVLFVALGMGWFAPKAVPVPMIGTLGLALFLYGVGLQYGKEFFLGLTSSAGLKANVMALAGVLSAGLVSLLLLKLGNLKLGYALGLFTGAGTSTSALQAAIATLGNDDAAVGYSLTYPIGVGGPILCLYIAHALLKPKVAKPTGAGMEMLEIAVRNPAFSGKALAELTSVLPAGLQIAGLRRTGRNEAASPNLVLAENDVLLAVAPTKEALAKAGKLLGEAAPGDFMKDRADLDYLRVFASRAALFGKAIGELELPGEKASVIIQVRRGDADVQPRPDLVIESGDRIGVLAHRDDFPAMRKFFGDSIKTTAEFSYISIGVGMALGFLLGAVQLPLPGIGRISVGVCGVLIMGLVLGKLRRTRGMNWTIPLSANLVIRNLGLTLFLAQVGMASGPKFAATVADTGLMMLGLGVIILLALVVPVLVLGLFVFRMPFDEVAGITAGACGNPAILAYANKLTPTDRPDIGYAMIFPAMTIVKILFVEIVPAFY